jgi:hypothetical protein
MRRFISKLSMLILCAAPVGVMHAQFNFAVAGRQVQVHSFLSEGFAQTNQNNYLTMKTSDGSADMFDAGVNASMQVTDKLRIGAQAYIRDFGRLGQWHPTLDYAYADYRFKDWFGIRGGKVKTVLGLFNEIQDNSSLFTFALLPQSVYPTDLRDATIGHTGGDIYGNVSLKRAGSLAYTAYAGQRKDTRYGGYIMMLQDRGVNMNSYGGLQYGADLKWTTPLKGVLIGASHMREEIDGSGTGTCSPAVPTDCAAWTARTHGQYEEHSKKDQTNFAYGQYTVGNLELDGEYRRYWRDQQVWDNSYEVRVDTRGWYMAAAYRISKHLALGTYYSRFDVKYVRANLAPSYDTSLPANHLYDKVISARIDLTRFWNVKVEGHFMDGWGGNQSPDGFYTQDNLQGVQPKTNMFLVRTGFSF